MQVYCEKPSFLKKLETPVEAAERRLLGAESGCVRPGAAGTARPGRAAALHAPALPVGSTSGATAGSGGKDSSATGPGLFGKPQPPSGSPGLEGTGAPGAPSHRPQSCRCREFSPARGQAASSALSGDWHLLKATPTPGTAG